MMLPRKAVNRLLEGPSSSLLTAPGAWGYGQSLEMNAQCLASCNVYNEDCIWCKNKRQKLDCWRMGVASVGFTSLIVEVAQS